MIIALFIIIHWYLSLFFQTFFLHRYAAHQQFTMTKLWEKIFYISAWISQGFTALSPNAYGKLHRMHHAFADTKDDVHSPKNDKSLTAMMIKTDKRFRAIRLGKVEVEDRFCINLPEWLIFEKFAYTWTAKIAWVVAYVLFYYKFVPENALWLWCLLPLHCLMTPIQGVIINWCAHIYGYTNYNLTNTSKNLMPFDIFMMGEGYHNNHHANPNKIRFSRKWYEIDPPHSIILLFDGIGIIKIKKANI